MSLSLFLSFSLSFLSVNQTPHRCCFFVLHWYSATILPRFWTFFFFCSYVSLLNFSNASTRTINRSQLLRSSLFLFTTTKNNRHPSCPHLASFARPIVSTKSIYSNAHWFSLRTSSSSSGVKSFLMLKVVRISAGVFPLIMFATVWQHKSSKSLMSK